MQRHPEKLLSQYGNQALKQRKPDSYQHYVMTGKGDTPEEKVNEAVKELNYHNMLVVIAVRDKTINNIGSIRAVA